MTDERFKLLGACAGQPDLDRHQTHSISKTLATRGYALTRLPDLQPAAQPKSDVPLVMTKQAYLS